MVYGRYRSGYSNGYTATDKTEGYHLVAPPVLGVSSGHFWVLSSPILRRIRLDFDLRCCKPGDYMLMFMFSILFCL